MGSLIGLLLKGVGYLLVVVVVLALVSAAISIVTSIVASLVSLLVSLAILAGVVLAVIGLFSLFSGSSGEEWDRERRQGMDPTARGHRTGPERQKSERSLKDRIFGGSDDREDRDPAERVRERYVAGEIDEAEFERKMELLMETENEEARLDRSRTTRGNSRDRDRDRILDR